MKITLITIALGVLMLTSISSYGQDTLTMTKADHKSMDSLNSVNEQEKASQSRKDEATIQDAKASKRETKAKAKEARRVEAEANDAARQSRNEYRTEKKAQKTRKDADKQAIKAAKARNKSDKN